MDEYSAEHLTHSLLWFNGFGLDADNDDKLIEPHRARVTTFRTRPLLESLACWETATLLFCGSVRRRAEVTAGASAEPESFATLTVDGV